MRIVDQNINVLRELPSLTSDLSHIHAINQLALLTSGYDLALRLDFYCLIVRYDTIDFERSISLILYGDAPLDGLRCGAFTKIEIGKQIHFGSLLGSYHKFIGDYRHTHFNIGTLTNAPLSIPCLKT